MKTTRRWVPSAFERLEDRLLLHGSSRGLSVVVSGLYPGEQVLNHRQQPVIAEVNQAFDSFVSDYDQARATYFASIQAPGSSSAAKAAFTSYTTQRVSLLAQQLISTFLQMPQGTARAHKQPELLQRLINTKIIAPATQVRSQPGSLNTALIATIPDSSNGPATASLYTLSQDNAIEAARVAVINGVNIAKNQDFGNQSHFHH